MCGECSVRLGWSDLDVPVPRDYEQVVTSFPFSHTLVAANGALAPADTEGLSDITLTEFVKMGMYRIYPTTVAFVSRILLPRGDLKY